MANTPSPFAALENQAGVGALTPYQRLDAPASAFGAFGAGLGDQLARDLEKVGAIFEEKQRLQDESTARDAVTAYRQAMIEKWGAYSKLSGREAVEGFDTFKADIEGLRQSTLANLPNDRTRQMAQPGVDGAWLDMLGNGQHYSSQQDRAWSLESSQASAVLSTNEAVLVRNDFAKVHQRLDSGAQEIVNASEINGDPPELTQLKVMQYYGESYAAVITSLMLDDPFKAQALYKSVEDQLDPVSRVSIAEKLEPRILDAQASALVTSVTQTAGTPTASGMTAFQWFVDKGWSTAQAAGIVGNLQQESGLNPEAVGDGGKAFGLAQWRDERLDALKEFAAANGLDYKTTEAQLQFIDYELKNSERAAGAALGGSTTVDEATDAFLGFERPQGWSSADPSGSHARTQRLAYANAFMAPAPGTVRDPEQDRAKLLELSKGNVKLATLALSKYDQQKNLQDIQLAQSRQELDVQIDNTRNALLAGEEVEIPEAKIRALYPEDLANQAVGELVMAQVGGRMFKAYGMASPEQIAAAYDDISSGTGLMSQMMRESFGADLSTDAGVAADKANRAKLLGVFDEMLKRRNDAINKDVALYGMQDPGVSAAFKALQESPSPEAWVAYATAQNALQEHLGVPVSDRRLLTEQFRENIIAKVTQDNPKGAADYFVALQGVTGDLWPQVFGEITSGQKAIPQEYLALGLIQDPVARTTYANALTIEKDKPGTLRAALGDTAKDFDDAVSEAMQPFIATLTAFPSQGSVQKAAVLTDSAKLLAYAQQGRVGADAAIDFAVKSITGQFDIVNEVGIASARAPKNYGGEQNFGYIMQVASDTMRYELTADDLKLLPNKSYDGRLYTEQEQRNITVTNARNGTWVTSPDDNGWVLIGSDGDVVYRADGSPVLLQWGDAKALSTGGPLTPAERGILNNNPARTLSGVNSEVEGGSSYQTPSTSKPSATRTGSFPTPQEAEDYAASGTAVGPAQPFVEGSAMGTFTDKYATEREAADALLKGSNLDDITKNIEGVYKDAIPKEIATQFAQAALAVKHSPLASLGFEPRLFLMGLDKSVADSVVGAYLRNNKGGEMLRYRPYQEEAAVAASTIVHESIHRGLAQMGVKLGSLEELVVRRIMDTEYGGVERSSGAPDDIMAEVDNNAASLDLLIKGLNAMAAMRVRDRKPGGPQ